MNKFIKKPETTKTNFKMYKDGKHWVFAGLMLLSVPMALMGTLEVSASETEKKAISATATSDDEADTIKTASIESPKVETNTTTNDVKTSEKTVSEVKPEATSSIEEKTEVGKEETKQEATSEVKEATPKADKSEEVMSEEEEAANAEANKDVEATLANTEYIKQINALTNLTAAQKKTYVDAVNSYNIIDKLNPLKSRDWYVKQAQALDKVMTNKNLTAADIKTFESQVANAGTGIAGGLLEGQEKLDTIVSRAKAVDTIRTTPNLTATDITAIVDQAYAAPTPTGSTNAINRAKNVSAMRVKPNLTDEDKNEFAKQIIADDAMATKRADAVAKIRTAPNLTDADKNKYASEMYKVSNDAAITTLTNKWTVADNIRGNKGLDVSKDQNGLIG